MFVDECDFCLDQSSFQQQATTNIITKVMIT